MEYLEATIYILSFDCFFSFKLGVQVKVQVFGCLFTWNYIVQFHWVVINFSIYEVDMNRFSVIDCYMLMFGPCVYVLYCVLEISCCFVNGAPYC